MPHEGIRIFEVQCGTHINHYWTDEKGIIQKANIIVGITNNHATICMFNKKVAQSLINKGEEITDGILNRIEMALRAYNPCFSYAYHSLPGHMPLIVNLDNKDGNLTRTIKRY
jgi:F420-non-reducing hydrogenase large subunit